MSRNFLTGNQASVKLGSEAVSGALFVTKQQLQRTGKADANSLNKYIPSQFVIDDDIKPIVHDGFSFRFNINNQTSATAVIRLV